MQNLYHGDFTDLLLDELEALEELQSIEESAQKAGYILE
jgi:hypothetical protein